MGCLKDLCETTSIGPSRREKELPCCKVGVHLEVPWEIATLDWMASGPKQYWLAIYIRSVLANLCCNLNKNQVSLPSSRQQVNGAICTNKANSAKQQFLARIRLWQDLKPGTGDGQQNVMLSQKLVKIWTMNPRRLLVQPTLRHGT